MFVCQFLSFVWPSTPKELRITLFSNRAFSHDVTAAILVFQNNETVAMLVYQTNPLGVELFSYVNTSFCFSKFACVLATWVKTLYKGNSILNKTKRVKLAILLKSCLRYRSINLLAFYRKCRSLIGYATHYSVIVLAPRISCSNFFSFASCTRLSGRGTTRSLWW